MTNNFTEVKLTPTVKRQRLKAEAEGEHSSWNASVIDNEEREVARRSGPVDPGVSKYTVMQLIQDASDRVQFEESQTHSAVWERFLKILLDNCEVPFVCCKYCKKVMLTMFLKLIHHVWFIF